MAISFAALRFPRGRRALLIAAAATLLLLALLAIFRLLHPPALVASDPVEAQAARFVTLALTLGEIEPKEVDAYLGPAALRPAKRGGATPSLDTMRGDLATLAADIARDPAAPRRDRLAARVGHLLALVDVMRAPRAYSFDDEARRVYGIEPVAIDEGALAAAKATLAALLPGSGPLAARVVAFRARYVIPEARRETVFARALAECRRRTLAHWPLPARERLSVEWTSTVDAAWHRYQGGYRSLLQINPQAVAFLGSAIDVACHEAYPGHHAQFVMQEQAAGPGGLPIEDRIVLLRSPDTMFREGAANYGVDLAFPSPERLAFERDILFPLAGFPPAEAARFEKVRAAIDRLSIATAPILRDYRDGRLAPADAAAALERDALVSSPQALLGFVDMLGPYALGYTVARDWVGAAVERAAGPGDRWPVLGRAVATVSLPTAKPAEDRR